MRRLLPALIGLVLAIQLVPVHRTNGPAAEDVGAPPAVADVLVRACNDCHSQATVWPWYGRVAPVSWLLAHDVNEGREHLDFSSWTALKPRRRAKLLGEIAKEVDEGEMPPALYRLMHPEARLDDATRAAVIAWARGAASAATPPGR